MSRSHKFHTLFATRLYQTQLSLVRNRALEQTCLGFAAEDRAGRRWAKEHGYDGYTSYASLNDLTRRASVMAELEQDIARHVARFARDAEFDLGGRKLALDSLWINVMDKGAVHTAHIHPHAVVSGTYYVAVPEEAGAIRFEDPRMAMLMAAPPKKPKAKPVNRPFVIITPKPGMLLLWESWLRHGVEPNRARGPRISISFNYA
ncbi:MAG TPA: TIGR02466 family protein [Rhizomicrobium sp.]|nr:TIGR02466 family protein [Rhizomicrobium sp.]